MAEHRAFEKLHVEEQEKADLGGLLEQLNLPPAFVDFVRKHQKTIYITFGTIAIAVIVWALYGSYVENRRVESSSALTLAQKLEGEERLTALQNVANDFSGTGSGIWARIEVARHYLENGDYQNGLQNYLAVREHIDDSNPLSTLVTFGIAQAHESMGNYDSALTEYEKLKRVKGYENIGYTGVGRIYEVQGQLDRAINEYEQYMGTLPGSLSENMEKRYISEKLSALKAQQ